MSEGLKARRDVLTIHASLYKVKLALEVMRIPQPGEFAPYEELKVTPFSFSAARSRHVVAVSRLADCLDRVAARVKEESNRVPCNCTGVCRSDRHASVLSLRRQVRIADPEDGAEQVQ